MNLGHLALFLSFSVSAPVSGVLGLHAVACLMADLTEEATWRVGHIRK